MRYQSLVTDFVHQNALSQLAAAERGLAGALARPRRAALVCIAVLSGLGWLALGLIGADYFSALCAPLGAGEWSGLAMLAPMWAAMTLAMMLPTAGPMILTYAEIAETAVRKGEPAATPLWLIAGYVGVWLGAAAVLGALQLGLTRLSLLDPAMASVSPLFSGAAFIGAGLYQFSALKHACVTQCQRPFPFFFANWTAQGRGVFRLGLRQGLYCLGCCWAMMLLMFAVGVMNVVWMAVLGMVMTIEKIGATTRFSRALGVLFIMVGAAFIVTAVVAHWPGTL
jgi:predicted metal-binding membrane protein